MRKLTGQKLADVYGNRYAQDLQRVAEVETLPAIYARYIGGGWIELSGRDLPSHIDLRTLSPNGWALHGKVRCKKAREFVRRFDTGESPIMG